MICAKCGNNNPDDSNFCSACGTKLNQPQTSSNGGFNQVPQNGGSNQVPQNGGFDQVPPNGGFNQVPPNGGFDQVPPNGGFNQVPPNGGFNQTPPGGFAPTQHNGMMPKSKNNAVLIGAAGAAVAVIALVFILIFALGGSPQKTANKLAKAVNKGDAKIMVEAMIPKSAIDKMEDIYDVDIDDIVDEFGDMDLIKEISGCKVKVRGKIEDFDKDDADDFVDDMEELGIRISDIDARKIDISYIQDGEKETNSEEAIFYKYKGKWYIFPSM